MNKQERIEAKIKERQQETRKYAVGQLTGWDVFPVDYKIPPLRPLGRPLCMGDCGMHVYTGQRF